MRAETSYFFFLILTIPMGHMTLFFVNQLLLFFPARLDLWEVFTLSGILNKPVSQAY